jgi:hypothetical protein
MFLQIAGLAAAAPGFPLFAAIPTVGAGEDLVFERGVKPLVDPDRRAYYLFRDEETQASYTLMRGPRHSKAPWSPLGDPIDYRVDVPTSTDGSDPLVEFFLAAEKLRDYIRSDAEEVARSCHLDSLTTVTLVDTPVMAFPHPKCGMYLGCSVSRFLVERGSIVNAGAAVSTRGEIPVVPPGDVEMRLLLLAQEELLARGILFQPSALNLVLRQLRHQGAAHGRA